MKRKKVQLTKTTIDGQKCLVVPVKSVLSLLAAQVENKILKDAYKGYLLKPVRVIKTYAEYKRYLKRQF